MQSDTKNSIAMLETATKVMAKQILEIQERYNNLANRVDKLENFKKVAQSLLNEVSITIGDENAEL